MTPKEDIKKEVKEILEIVKLCPQHLQEKCFEMFLTHYIESHKRPTRTPAPVDDGGDTGKKSNGDMPEAPEEVTKRVRIFAGQNSLSTDEVNKAFSFDELGNVNIEVTDLKATKTAQKQRKLALLIALRHLFLDGSLEVPVQELREMCVTYATYDAPNFSTNMKNMSAIFAGFKSGANNKLSPVGKKEAASVVKELSS